MDTPIDIVTRARNEDAFVFLTLYCECTDCPVREVEVACKDHDSILLLMLDADEDGKLRTICPLCLSRLKFHGVQTHHEHSAMERMVEETRDAWRNPYGTVKVQ